MNSEAQASAGDPVLPGRQRWLPWAAGGLTLALLGGAILLTRAQLRTELRTQMASRDAQVLRAILQQQLAGAMGKADTDPLLAVLDASTLPELPGIIGIRLFNEDGAFFTGLLAATNEVTLEAGVLERVRANQAVSRFHPEATRGDASGLALTGAVPVLEMTLPLPDAAGRLTGVAQFYFEGAGLAAEFEALDRNLRRQALLAFGLAGTAIGGALAFAFRRLDRANQELEHRTRSLLRANQELTLAAKTSAVGAVTSHLLHGLKNPLAGLQQFVTAHATNEGPGPGGSPDDSEWRDAAATTRRMKAMIDGVLRVLRDEQGVAGYQLSLRELLDALTRKLATAVTDHGVRLVTDCRAEAELPARDANLVLLILENLAANAIQATPAGQSVEVRCAVESGVPVFRVSDRGAGLPSHVREGLFTPVRSSKEGGTGLGLALSRQLALHLGATLELARSDAAGTEFVLRLPAVEVAVPTRT